MKRLNEHKLFLICSAMFKTLPFNDGLNKVADFWVYFTNEEIEGLLSLAFI